MALSPRQRKRRVAIVCCNNLRNVAYYRAWHLEGKPNEDNDFWRSTNSNALDMAVLEWYKLFADARSKHNYSKVVADPVQFKTDMLTTMHTTEAAFDAYVEQVKTYRDKFVAHLDDKLEMLIPALGVMRASTTFLYNGLLAQEAGQDTFRDAAATNGTTFYNKCLKLGRTSCKA